MPITDELVAVLMNLLRVRVSVVERIGWYTR